MLETLDQIPWATLQHAYGSAADIPDQIRALISDDEEKRKDGQGTLEFSAFHQGSIYTCTPYVAHFLLELMQQESVPEKAWIFSYLSRLHQSAGWTLDDPKAQADDDIQDAWSTMTRGAWRRQQHQIAHQIQNEIYPHTDVFLETLKNSRAEVRFSVILYLTTLTPVTSQTVHALQQAFVEEQETKTRAALAFALGATRIPDSEDILEMLLADDNEPIEVRLAVGFGWIMSRKDNTPNSVLSELATLIQGNQAALWELDDLYYDLSCPGRLLELLYTLSPEQKLMFVFPLLDAYMRLPLVRDSTMRMRGAYYMNVLVRVTFPGVLAAETIIHDFSNLQRAVLETFQTYQMLHTDWSDWSLSGFRDALGLEVMNQAEFLAFMAGERSVRQVGSRFDQRITKRLSTDSL